jgi:DNA ligase (NAD+)
VDAESLPAAVARFRDDVHSHPLLTDGLVLTVDNIAAAAALGATSKFPRDSIAFKWADELATTTLRHIEWNTSRTGAINPVAVFDAVDIEGTSVSRASVHNLSILRQLNLRAGDQITVYKANMIIPQVAENLTAHEGYSPDWCAECPSCGGETEIQGDPEILTCPNPACPAQRLRALSHFVSRDAMNIAGLSEQTLEKLIDAGIIQSYLDIFSLAQHEEKITSMDGFGKKSFDKLIAATEAAKNVIPSNFIHALGIRHVGLANAKLLCAHFNFDLCRIATGCLAENYLEQLLEIHGFGEAIAGSLHAFFASEANHAAFAKACEIMNFQIPAISAGGALDGRVFVVTGDVHKFDNRKALANFIEANGGRVSGSVSAKTSYLINNDTASTSGKNKKARQLGIPVISEDELLGLLESA